MLTTPTKRPLCSIGTAERLRPLFDVIRGHLHGRKSRIFEAVRNVDDVLKTFADRAVIAIENGDYSTRRARRWHDGPRRALPGRRALQAPGGAALRSSDMLNRLISRESYLAFSSRWATATSAQCCTTEPTSTGSSS